MRKLTRGALGRVLAAGTCFAFLLTTFLTGLLVAPRAQAQLASVEPAVKPPPRAAVIEFQAPAGAMLGRRAADAVWVALKSMSGAPYTPEPAESVADAVKELGLRPPLDRDAQQQLGEQLNVKWVIGGEVRRARIANGRAEVELLVTDLSVDSGDYATGALVRATAPRPPGFRGDDDILIDEALQFAARDATRLLAAGKIPQASVLMTFSRNEVQLSAGRPAGLIVGMRLALLRLVEGHWRRVGTLEVNASGDHDATASVIANPRGIQTNDRVMAIWDPSSAQIGIASRPETTKGASLSKGIIPLLAIGLLIAGFNAHSRRPDKRRSNTPTACPLVDGNGVVVSWAPPGQFVLGVEVWRLTGATRTLVAALGRENNPWSAEFQAAHFVDSTTPEMGSLCITLSDPTQENLLVDYSGTRGPAGTDIEPCDAGSDTANRTLAWDPPPLVVGQPVSYQLVFIIAKKVQNTGEVGSGAPPTVQWVLSEYTASKVSNAITPLAPVTLVAPLGTTGEDATNTEFRFTAEGDPTVTLPTTGANQYVIQISRDPSFPPSGTGEFPAAPNYHRQVYAPGDSVRLTVDYSNMLTPAERAGCVQLFWRVGARNLADKCRPVSYPEDPSREGWVFGPPNNIGSFTATVSGTCP
jgi:hypothetical protein